MKRKMYFILIFTLVVVVRGQSQSSSVKTEKLQSQNIQKKCSFVNEGLQFCTSSPFVSVESGESVMLNLSLQNMTKQNVPVIVSRLDDYYNVIVTNSKGDKIYSFSEALQKRFEEGKVSLEEVIASLPVNTRKKIILAPNQSLNFQANLSQFYDLSSKDKYFVEISRKVLKKDGTGNTELSFGKIEIDVK
jgi:hypothetical protein